MNCQKLQETLNQIHELQSQIETSWNQASQNGQLSPNLQDQLKQIEELQDQLLSENLDKFTELYPELVKAENIEYSEEIPGFGSDIATTLQLQDGTVLVAGDDGETRVMNIEYQELNLDRLKDFLRQKNKHETHFN